MNNFFNSILYSFKVAIPHFIVIVFLFVIFAIISRIIVQILFDDALGKCKKRGLFNDVKIKYVSSKNKEGKLLYENLNENFAYGHAACFDILSASEEDIQIEPGKSTTVPSGLTFCLPFDLELQIRPKSGWSRKMVQVAFGTVDGDYRGEVGVTLYNLSDESITIKYGDKIAQGKIDRVIFSPADDDSFIRVDSKEDFDSDLKETSRGSNGFGSSGISTK